MQVWTRKYILANFKAATVILVQGLHNEAWGLAWYEA